MVLTALRGAVGFLTRLPVGHTERAWAAFGDVPATIVPVGYAVGALVSVPFALTAIVSIPGSALWFAYVLGVLLVTGITHADGLADVGDALAVHGSPARRREVMADAELGVGGTVAVGVDLVGLVTAAVALDSLPVTVAVGLVVAAEVGAKLAMVVPATLGEAAHSGLGSHLTGAGRGQLIVAVTLALPAGLLTWPSVAAVAGLLAAVVTGFAVLAWANRSVGGVTGDVLGATNELARLAALHVGVIAWTLS